MSFFFFFLLTGRSQFSVFFFFLLPGLLTSAVSPRDLGLTSAWTEWKPERAARVARGSCCQKYGWRVEARPPLDLADFSGF
jgi:hypothetical protein